MLQGPLRDKSEQAMKSLAPTWYVQVVPLTASDSSFGQLTAELRTASPERMKRELAAFLQEVSRPRPLVLFFDDLQWSDASTVDLLAYLADKTATLPILVLLTYRDSDLRQGRHPFLALQREMRAPGVFREVALELLGLEDVDRYLALSFPDHRFPVGIVPMLHRRTGGNPLFLVDLLRYLRERGKLAEVDGHWQLTLGLPEIADDLPDSVHDIVRRKLEQVAEDGRRLLVAASVQGPRVRLGSRRLGAGPRPRGGRRKSGWRPSTASTLLSESRAAAERISP